MGSGLRYYFSDSLAASDDTSEVWVVDYRRYVTADYILEQSYSSDGGDTWVEGTDVETSSGYRCYYPSVGTNVGTYTDHKVMGTTWNSNIRYYTWDTTPDPDNFT